jgi:hypothetical protein
VGGSCIPLALGLASCTCVLVKFVRYWHNSNRFDKKLVKKSGFRFRSSRVSGWRLSVVRDSSLLFSPLSCFT